jgi:hypothetical protein
MTMRTPLRVLKIVLGFLLILIVCVLLAWKLLPDALPLAEVNELRKPVVPVAGLENGFDILVGITASADQDPAIAGKRAIASASARLKTATVNDVIELDDALGPNKLALQSKDALCKYDKEPCLDLYVSMREIVQKRVVDDALLLARYRRLLATPQYVEYLPVTVITPAPNYSVLFRLSELSDAQHAAAIVATPSDLRTLEMFVSELRFMRKIYACSSGLIGRMVAIAILQRKLQLVDELLSRRPELATNVLLERALAPLDSAEKSMVQPMNGEVRMNDHTFQSVLLDPKANRDNPLGQRLVRASYYWLMRDAIKPNASVNHFQTRMRRTIEAMDASPKQALAYFLKHRDHSAPTDPSIWGPLLRSAFYNPVGNMLNEVGKPSAEIYFLRNHDLDAYWRLLAVKRKLIAENVGVDRMNEALGALPAQLFDPYTERPPIWDAAKKRLFVEGHGNRYAKDGRFEVSLPER